MSYTPHNEKWVARIALFARPDHDGCFRESYRDSELSADFLDVQCCACRWRDERILVRDQKHLVRTGCNAFFKYVKHGGRRRRQAVARRMACQMMRHEERRHEIARTVRRIFEIRR